MFCEYQQWAYMHNSLSDLVLEWFATLIYFKIFFFPWSSFFEQLHELKLG